MQSERTVRASQRVRRLALLRALLVVIVVVALDQLTKQILESSLRPGAESKLIPGVAFVNTRNSGIAFGVQPGSYVLVSVVIGLALPVLPLHVSHFSFPAPRTAAMSVTESAQNSSRVNSPNEYVGVILPSKALLRSRILVRISSNCLSPGSFRVSSIHSSKAAWSLPCFLQNLMVDTPSILLRV